MLLEFARKTFVLTDEWFGMDMNDIRVLEDKIKAELDAQTAIPNELAGQSPASFQGQFPSSSPSLSPSSQSQSPSISTSSQSQSQSQSQEDESEQ